MLARLDASDIDPGVPLDVIDPNPVSTLLNEGARDAAVGAVARISELLCLPALC